MAVHLSVLANLFDLLMFEFAECLVVELFVLMAENAVGLKAENAVGLKAGRLESKQKNKLEIHF